MHWPWPRTLSVFREGQTWYTLSKKDEVLGTNLTIWTAPSAAGPFTAQPVSASIPSDAVSGTVRYVPLVHPNLTPEPPPSSLVTAPTTPTSGSSATIRVVAARGSRGWSFPNQRDRPTTGARAAPERSRWAGPR